MDYDDLAELRDAFNERANLASSCEANPTQKSWRVFVPRRAGVALDRHAAAELRRGNLLYLIRLAPLTQGHALTPTGNFFSTLQRDNNAVAAYQNRYAAKFGYTTRTSGVRLPEVIGEITSKGFPESGLHPIYALAIDGLPHDRLLLYHMENGLRNLLDRDGLRLRQHAQGVLHPGNRTAMAETFEFVHADANCNRLFQLFDQYARRLNAARRWVRSLVTVFDILRNQVGENGREETLQDGPVVAAATFTARP